MNKVMKAGIAAGAAGVLLLGGAGTFALWNDSTSVDAGSVSTGHLKLNASAAGAWTDISGADPGVAFNPATDHIVPGDTVKFAQTVTIDADGKNLKGALTVGNLASAIPASLSADVQVSIAADLTAPNVSSAGNVISFTAPGTYEVPVTITVSFAKGTTASTADTTMDQTVNLDNLALSLDQVRP